MRFVTQQEFKNAKIGEIGSYVKQSRASEGGVSFIYHSGTRDPRVHREVIFNLDQYTADVTPGTTTKGGTYEGAIRAFAQLRKGLIETLTIQGIPGLNYGVLMGIPKNWEEIVYVLWDDQDIANAENFTLHYLASLNEAARPKEELAVYTWVPKGHGDYSVAVMAASVEEAKNAITQHVTAEVKKNPLSVHGYTGWGTDYYEGPIVTPRGVIVTFNND